MEDKVRVYEVAEESGASSAEVITKAADLAIELKSPQSTLSFDQAEAIVNYIMTGKSKLLKVVAPKVTIVKKTVASEDAVINETVISEKPAAAEVVETPVVKEEVAIESTFDLSAAKAEIETANEKFVAFWAETNSTGVASLYTEDTKMMLAEIPTVEGRENIATTLTGFMSMGISNVDLKTVEVWGTAECLTEEGTYTMFAGEDIAEEGKYLVLWKNVNGNWKLHRDIFTSNAPSH